MMFSMSMPPQSRHENEILNFKKGRDDSKIRRMMNEQIESEKEMENDTILELNTPVAHDNDSGSNIQYFS
jgi:hypothetical protein